MEKQQVGNGNTPEGIVIEKDIPLPEPTVDVEEDFFSEKSMEQYQWEREEEKKKHPYISRNDYLKSLPKDEYGNPIIDKQEFWKLSRLHNWEEDFLQSAISAGIVEAEGIPEYFMDTSEYGV